MSSEPEMTVTAKCPKCDVPVQCEDEQNDDAAVKCPECGEQFGTLGEVREVLKQKATDHVKDMFKTAFKKHPWIKVK